MLRTISTRAFLLALAAAVITACQSDAPLSPEIETYEGPEFEQLGSHTPSIQAHLSPQGSAEVRVKPYVCKIPRPIKWSGLVTPAGGVLVSKTAPKNAIYFPKHAVKRATWIEAVIPASGVLEIDIRANRQDHFVFNKPIRVTLDYGMCGPRAQPPRNAWHWDGSSKFFERMPGFVVNTRAKTITFETDHLTGFIIAD